MNLIRFVRFATLLLAATALTNAFGASRADAEKAMSHDGLSKITVKGIELAYARPGATLAGYNRVKLDPVEVAFRKNWQPTRAGSTSRLSAEEREGIRASVAKVVQEEFVKALQAGGGYQVVNEAGPDVLRVRIQITDLFMTAPDAKSPGYVRTYALSAGEMSLAAELYDSESGELLARVIDRREARSVGRQMMLITSQVNAEEGRHMASGWARILRDGLDKAHGIGKK